MSIGGELSELMAAVGAVMSGGAALGSLLMGAIAWLGGIRGEPLLARAGDGALGGAGIGLMVILLEEGGLL